MTKFQDIQAANITLEATKAASKVMETATSVATSLSSDNGNKVTVRELYQLVDHKVGEVNNSIQRLETKFDNLEAGRLTRLEGTVATLLAQVGAKKDQDRMIGGIIAVIVSAAITFFSIWLKH